MARNPKEQWERLQLMLQHRGGRGGFGFGGGFPSGGGRGGGVGVAVLVLAIGGYALSNSLFNGESNYIPCAWMIPGDLADFLSSRWWSPCDQILEDRWCEEGDLQRRYDLALLCYLSILSFSYSVKLCDPF